MQTSLETRYSKFGVGVVYTLEYDGQRIAVGESKPRGFDIWQFDPTPEMVRMTNAQSRTVRGEEAAGFYALMVASEYKAYSRALEESKS